jgi:hypothetical protein
MAGGAVGIEDLFSGTNITSEGRLYDKEGSNSGSGSSLGNL